MHVLSIIDLNWGQQTFFCKRSDSKHFRLCRPHISVELFNSATLAEGKCHGTIEESVVYTLLVLTLTTAFGDVYDLSFYI